jgi:hypothetical protein
MKNVGFRCTFVLAVAVVALFARNAAAQYYPYPYLEAECPDTATGAYLTKQTSIGGFAGTGYLRSTGNISATTYNNTSADHAVYQFTTKHFAYYRVWFRVNTNNSLSDDSFFYLIDPSFYPDWVTVNGIPGQGWQWIQGNVFGLGAGAHTLEIANREDGLNIDKIAILPYEQAGPSGLGAAAYNCPVTMYFETECRTGAYAAYQKDKVQKTGFSGTGYIESATTTLTSSPRVDEATYYFETGAGAYNFFFRIHNNSNISSDSWFYSVDTQSFVTMNNTSGLGSGWRWAQGAGSITLTHGKHTLRIRNRESGLSIDKIAFVPSSITGPSGTGSGGMAVNCEPFQTMSDWGPGEVAEYYITHYGFFAEMGEEMLPEHASWHFTNNQGGQNGPGSGTAFLGYHRAMLNQLRAYALETNGRSWLPISTTGRSIPVNLEDSYQALMASGMLAEYEPRTDSAVTDFGIPQYLTIGAIPHPDWPQTSVGANGKSYTRLEEFDTLDALGQGIGFSYHGMYHSRVGGTMSDFTISPSDPIFYGWHGLIDKIVTTWLTTTKGQQWKAANASHPFLVAGYTTTDGWNNADWD